ncbi:probable E3 ubiquitin-protein ligase ARI8 [Lingula anatina]|uniref:Probable E3 ubiquitin-protein ligase ARI8 n=1 Tax=Lingula anatina TaxID=7574 RepID=A0A1S3J9C8_LINAN|nr:probable E3 ubiquitin-protein ligase ARI8 [Lingula anatina]|eukprot:XP_013407007.1 probable E3 ubiquitin-protein ligase ARI8 [Lingula anatina]
MEGVLVIGMAGERIKISVPGYSDIGKASVKALKQEIVGQWPKSFEYDQFYLLFAGVTLTDKNSYNEEAILQDYGVKDGSTILMVIRLNGGQAKRYDQKLHSSFLTKEADVITGDDDPDSWRGKMSCGHAVDPDMLTGYSKHELEKGRLDVKCPECKAKWGFTEIREKALLDQEEQRALEVMWSKNAIKTTKKCPGCQSIVERADLSNLRVHCGYCTKSFGRCYDFCWRCLREWPKFGPTTNKVGCGYCINEKDLSLFLLANCDEIDLPDCKIGQKVPRVRACPNCGQLCEHNTEACKNIMCVACGKEFCFVCLMFTSICCKEGGWHEKCSRGVAPRQTVIPTLKS